MIDLIYMKKLILEYLTIKTFPINSCFEKLFYVIHYIIQYIMNVLLTFTSEEKKTNKKCYAHVVCIQHNPLSVHTMCL